MDFGLKTFLSLSDGSVIRSPEFFRQGVNEVRKANRALSRKVMGSNGYDRALKALYRRHRDIANRRRDWFWKLSHELCVRDHRFQPENDHRFQPVQMSSNSTNIQNAVDSIFVSLSYLRQYGSVAEVHLSDYLVLSSVRLACKVEAIGSVEKTVQYALRKN